MNALVGAGIVAAAFVLWLVWIAATRRRLAALRRLRREGPPTMDLGPEPPAVVNLLLHEMTTTGDALAATMLDLAARGYLEVVQLAPDEHLIVPRRRERSGLTAYEVQVLEVIDRAAGDHPEATVPAIAEALGPGSATTWLRFTAAVAADARARGLVGPASRAAAQRWLLMITGLACAGVLEIQPLAWPAVVPILVVFPIGGIVAVAVGNSSVATEAGQVAGARWLGVRRFIVDAGSLRDLPAGAVAIWDRHLAYGAAMGLSGTAVHSLVDQLRTTLSLADVRTAVHEANGLSRAVRDPALFHRWRVEHVPEVFGAGTDPDAIYGPDDGTFLDLLRRTGQGWSIARAARRGDEQLWRAASLARVDRLVATAPPELADDVELLATAARRAIDLLLRSIVPTPEEQGRAQADLVTARLRAEPAIGAEPTSQAACRIVAWVASGLGCRPDLDHVAAALGAAPLDIGSLGHVVHPPGTGTSRHPDERTTPNG